MITNHSLAISGNSDAELVARSLAGDRDSFNRIVVRYQTLICSLAYNALGNLGQSEDVAQETFIIAWKQLPHLREPEKLRAWLCGIVRNRIHKNLDRELREPARNAETLESMPEAPTDAALPSEEAISKEEQAILWRSLERIPPTYRESLILFYREHQSIEAVAAELELSEDAVKQRLSRGRKLLQEEVQSFVEKALIRTAPSGAFAGAVAAALAVTPAATAGVSVASQGAVVTKTGMQWSWLAPFAGVLGGLSAHWLIVQAAPTERERRLKKFAYTGFWFFVLAWCIPIQLGVRALARHQEWSDLVLFRVMAGFWWFYAMTLATFSVAMFQRILAIRRENEVTPGAIIHQGRRLSRGAHIALLGGVYMACFWWLIDLARQAHDWFFTVLITVIMVILAAGQFFQVRNKTGAAAMLAIAGRLALVWGVIFAILIFRLESWLASLHGMDIAGVRRLIPVWVIPALALSVAAWVGLLLQIARTKSTPSTSPKKGT